ncbi:MAG: amidohydrolase, partial [Clostridia bacterium]|nr:amidohydrolase [Clostridia bacterium]
MKIIDIHTHIYPEQIAVKAADSIRDFYEIYGGTMDGTAATLLDRCRAAGIGHQVILPVAVRPDRVRSINDFIRHQADEHSSFIPFGTVHAAMEDVGGETERILELGMKGIKLHPDFSRFGLDDERLFPMYETVRGKIPVILHMGDRRYDWSHPHRLRRLLELFPGLEVIAAHFGGYTMYETAYELLYDTDCVMDISSSMMFMEPGVAEKYINIYGAERMAYGTDYPLWDPVTGVEVFTQLTLSADQFDQIAHKTAERI